ncbi:MAG: DSD1 family PLP-dependent enzyme [Candidatus Lokiarchaeota archaeon]|nr:DSD1 family PLP-dependent enzyme [Candidatus Lokiarchaeota archaeon]
MNKKLKDKITTPALVLDIKKLKKNIKTMANFAQSNNINLRPHVKTHKCPKIAEMQVKEGANGITVAKVSEAEVFVDHGFSDILIANEIVCEEKIVKLLNLAKNNEISVAVDSKKNVKDLDRLSKKLQTTLNILVDIDVGLVRTGTKPGEPALELAELVDKAPYLNLKGLMGYEGHLSFIKDEDKKEIETNKCMKKLTDTKELLESNGLKISVISAGGTPTYKYTGKYPGITEIQPGTYVFMDHHYMSMLPEFELALTVLTTVMSKPMKRMATLDMGSKSIYNEGYPKFIESNKIKVQVLTEEHCQVTYRKIDLKIGDKIQAIPPHVCPTVNLYDFYTLIHNDELIGTWEIPARGKNT